MILKLYSNDFVYFLIISTLCARRKRSEMSLKKYIKLIY